MDGAFERRQAPMTVVCDMGPLQYLVLIGCDHTLPLLFGRVLTARVVIEKETRDPRMPPPAPIPTA